MGNRNTGLCAFRPDERSDWHVRPGPRISSTPSRWHPVVRDAGPAASRETRRALADRLSSVLGGTRIADILKLKVVLVGPPRAGKTSLVRRHVLGAFDDAYRATLGTNVYKWTGPLDVGGRAVRVAMTVWDFAGDARVPDALLELHLVGAQGVLAVCDVTDPASARDLAPWTGAAARVAGDVAVHVLLNKRDLGPRDDAVLAALEAARGRAAPCYVTSAKTGDNVSAAFQDLARRIVARAAIPPDGPVDDTDRRLAMACAGPRTAEDLSRARSLPVPIAEARLERLRRAGYVQIASLGVDPEGRPRIAYEATGRPYAEPLLAGHA